MTLRRRRLPLDLAAAPCLYCMRLDTGCSAAGQRAWFGIMRSPVRIRPPRPIYCSSAFWQYARIWHLRTSIASRPGGCSTPTAVAGMNRGHPAAPCSARRWPMLRMSALTPAQQREVRRWQAGGDQHLARRAQVVLWSARGWSVPALAHALGGCRRTVRRWVQAFLDAGLTGLLGRLVAGGSVRGSTADSASGSDPPATY